MRRIQTGVIAVCLAAALLSGCAGSSAQSTASSTAASSAAASSISTTAVSANYDGGSGTQEDPYQINSVDSLLTFASNVNDGSQGGYAGVSFKLTSDLDLSGVEWAPIGNMNDMETHSTLFLGSFDGDGHTISNLNYTSDVYNCGAGLFGVSCGEVKNLTLENATVTVTEGTSMAIGGVVGYNMGSVDNVTLKGDSTITGNNCVGGIVHRAAGVYRQREQQKVPPAHLPQPPGGEKSDPVLQLRRGRGRGLYPLQHLHPIKNRAPVQSTGRFRLGAGAFCVPVSGRVFKRQRAPLCTATKNVGGACNSSTVGVQ